MSDDHAQNPPARRRRTPQSMRESPRRIDLGDVLAALGPSVPRSVATRLARAAVRSIAVYGRARAQARFRAAQEERRRRELAAYETEVARLINRLHAAAACAPPCTRGEFIRSSVEEQTRSLMWTHGEMPAPRRRGPKRDDILHQLVWDLCTSFGRHGVRVPKAHAGNSPSSGWRVWRSVT